MCCCEVLRKTRSSPEIIQAVALVGVVCGFQKAGGGDVEVGRIGIRFVAGSPMISCADVAGLQKSSSCSSSSFLLLPLMKYRALTAGTDISCDHVARSSAKAGGSADSAMDDSRISRENTLSEGVGSPLVGWK